MIRGEYTNECICYLDIRTFLIIIHVEYVTEKHIHVHVVIIIDHTHCRSQSELESL